MKDLSEETIAELTNRLRSDEVSCNQFYYSFGLEDNHPRKVFGEIRNISKLFPDTPIKLVIDVCRALKLYDLVELLEKAAKPRTLRAALPLKEIAKLPSDSNRLTTFYSKVNIMFVDDGAEIFNTIGNLFKKICPGSKISRSQPQFDLSHKQFFVSESLDGEKEKILRSFRRVRLLRSVKTETRKDEIEEELSREDGELQEKKKTVKADISSAFDKSWGEERGKILIS